jgi:hypothetical protein
MKDKKPRTLMSPGIELRSVWIKLFISGRELIDLRGLKILNVRKALRAPASKNGSHPITEMITIKRSSQFHGSLMYEFLCQTKPIAMSLLRHSIKNIIEKAVSK